MYVCVNVSTLTRENKLKAHLWFLGKFGEKSLKVKRIRVYRKTKNRPLRENS